MESLLEDLILKMKVRGAKMTNGFSRELKRQAAEPAPKVVRIEEDVYTRLVAAGCKISNHESDLYVECTETALRITDNEPNRTFFYSNLDGNRWIELPFQFTPFWTRRTGV